MSTTSSRSKGKRSLPVSTDESHEHEEQMNNDDSLDLDSVDSEFGLFVDDEAKIEVVVEEETERKSKNAKSSAQSIHLGGPESNDTVNVFPLSATPTSYFTASELLAATLSFMHTDLQCDEHDASAASPVQLAAHAAFGQATLEREASLERVLHIVENRWLACVNKESQLRLDLLLTAGGPGAGKSHFIDEFLKARLPAAPSNPFDADFAAALPSAIRIAVSLNDKMSLDPDVPFDSSTHFRPITMISVRAIFSYALPPSEFDSTTAWELFVEKLGPRVPPLLDFRHTIDAIVAHHATITCPHPGWPSIVLFGVDELLKISAAKRAPILSALGTRQDTGRRSRFVFVPLITSLALDTTRDEILTVSGRKAIHPLIEIPPLPLSKCLEFLSPALRTNRVAQLLAHETAGVPRLLEHLEKTFQNFDVDIANFDDVVSKWISLCSSYTMFFSTTSPVPLMPLLRAALLPPFVPLLVAKEIISGNFTIEQLVMHGALSSSRVPQIPGVHLRAFARNFLANQDDTLRGCARALYSIFDDYSQEDFVVLEKFIMQRELLVRLLAPASGVAFLHRYPSQLEQWFPENSLFSLDVLVFASPLSASRINSDAALSFDDCFSSKRLAAETAVWKMAPGTAGIDLIVKDKLSDGRTFYGLVQAKMTVADHRTLRPLPAVKLLADCVKEVQSRDPSAEVVAMLITNNLLMPATVALIKELVSEQAAFRLGLFDRSTLINLFGPTLHLHPRFHEFSEDRVEIATR